MGRHHLEVLSRNRDFDIVGVADPTASVRDALQSRGHRVFADYREMLDSIRPEAVVVATPNAHHVPVARECIARGVAALIEKPVSDSLESALALEALAAPSGVPVLVGHHRRHNPLLKRAAEHIGSGEIGHIVAVVGLWLRRKPDEYFEDRWKQQASQGGGVLLINTIHDIDCLRMLCGEIASIDAATSNQTRGLDVEDTAAVTLTFANGAVGTLTISDATVAPWCWEMTAQEDTRFAMLPEDCYLVCGSRGSLAIPTLEHWSNEPNAGRDAPFTRRRLYYVPADALTEQIAHFARVVRGEETPLVDVANATRTLAATLAIREAAARQRRVHIFDLLAQSASQGLAT